MASEAPPFWWQEPDWRARVLWPVSAIYGLVAGRRMRNGKRALVEAPVLCIGNFTVGGTGKTPTAIAFAKVARDKGFTPGILSRGYGGSLDAPRLVDPDHDIAKHVGDEPLLMARHATVAVTPDRAAGAALLVAYGCDFVIMDDGFQSARIGIDCALAVIDARHGLGNGHVIPGGPLRAPLSEQMRHVTAILRMGQGSAADRIVRMASRAGKAVFQASTQPVNGEAVSRRRLLAFAGIGHPGRFFASLEQAGGKVVVARSFPDHHFYQQDELTELASIATRDKLDLVTTEKDAARLRHIGLPEKLRAKIRVLEVETVFDDPAAPARIIDQTVLAFRQRKFRDK